MENNYGYRNQSNQRDWNQNDQGNDRDRDYENRNQRSEYGSGGNQNFNNQAWQNRGGRGFNDQYNNQYGDQRRNYEEQSRRNSLSDYDQGNWRDNDRDNRSGNRNPDQRNYGNNNNRNSGDRNWFDRTTDEVSSWFGNDEAERRRQMDKANGPHHGKGPKGYTRSDDRITEDINDKLYHDSYVDASNIEVKVSNGEAIISGTVDSRETKHRAEDLVESVSGVKNVQNQLKVNNGNNAGTSIFDKSNPSEAENNRKKSSLAN